MELASSSASVAPLTVSWCLVMLLLFFWLTLFWFQMKCMVLDKQVLCTCLFYPSSKMLTFVLDTLKIRRWNGRVHKLICWTKRKWKEFVDKHKFCLGCEKVGEIFGCVGWNFLPLFDVFRSFRFRLIGESMRQNEMDWEEKMESLPFLKYNDLNKAH